MLNSPPSKIIYHYTGAQGLTGIIENDCIWASQCQYLNDSAEFQHSIDLLLTTLNNLPFPGSTAQELKDGISAYMRRIDPLLFIACFSEDNDSLSQWRSYCPPSLGFNIGFNLDKLIPLAEAQRFQIGECIYDPDVQEQFCKNWALSNLVDFVERFPRGGNATQFIQANMNGPLNFFIDKCSFFKHSAFKEEKEYRLISLMPPAMEKIKTRIGKSMFVPYMPFALGLKTEESPICTLTVGPTPNKHRAEQSLEFLVRGIRNFSYWKSSNIPYRDW